MAAKKAKKKLANKSRSRKTRAPAKAAKPSAKKSPRGGGTDESSESLRASAKSFAFRLLR